MFFNVFQIENRQIIIFKISKMVETLIYRKPHDCLLSGSKLASSTSERRFEMRLTVK